MPNSTKRVATRTDGRTRQRRSTGRTTLRDVAEHLGISQISVSRYFQEPERLSAELRARIKQGVDALGYVPNLVAGGLASARSRVIGMVVPNISGPVFADTIQSFSDAVSARGYQLLLASSYFSESLEENAVRAFLGWSPAALVIESTHHSAATEEMIARAQVPVIEAWSFRPERGPMQIGFSQTEAGRLAAQHLVERGYRRIAYVQTAIAGDVNARDRCDGYVAVMREHGLEPRVFVPTEAMPFNAGKQAIEALTRGPEPTDALVFANDNLAAGALLCAPGLGLEVPRDCAIVGFGDFAFSSMLTPGLTTVRPPASAIGTLAAQRIFELIDGEEQGQAIAQAQRIDSLPCMLVERGSTN